MNYSSTNDLWSDVFRYTTVTRMYGKSAKS